MNWDRQLAVAFAVFTHAGLQKLVIRAHRSILCPKQSVIPNFPVSSKTCLANILSTSTFVNGKTGVQFF